MEQHGDDRRDGSEADARLAVAEKALRQAGRELKWWQIELEHTTESLQRARRQRSRLRDQNEELAAALAQAWSEQYWATQQPAGGIGRLLGRGGADDPEAALVREVEASPLFRGGWYLRQHPHALRARLSPALHYVRHGNERDLDPGPEFSTSDYLEKHPDVGNLPALVHAIRNDGRQ